jgi:3-oxoacyl-[acyl-carrier-protein] synthase-3
MKIGIKFGGEIYDVKAKLIELYGAEITQATLDKTGPVSLFHSKEEEDALSLAIESIEQLIVQHNVDINDIENLVSVTESPRNPFPGNASIIASSFPFKKTISTYDLNAGCTGFVDAIKICMGINTNSLIICSETYSKHIHNFNRATSTLFSDGAAAIYFRPSDWTLLESCALFKSNTYKYISLEKLSSELNMDGKEVFNFVASNVMPELKEIFTKYPSIDRAYIHQGSKLVVDYIGTRLRGTNTKIPSNIENLGNFVSATLPILIYEDVQNNAIKSGETILLVGFGVGLFFSACIIQKK